MDEATRQIYGRLTAHETLLEVLYAQLWASTSAEDAEDVASSLKRITRQA